MIKAVQKGLCELAKANDVRPTRSDNNLTHSFSSNDTEDDDDCVYISPDETENGIFNSPFSNLQYAQKMIQKNTMK